MSGNEVILGVLLVTCLLHGVSALLLFRLGASGEKPLVWNLLGLAVGILGVQKTVTFYTQYTENSSIAFNMFQEFLSCLVAGLLLGGVILLSPILQVLQRNKELLTVIEERNVIIYQFHEQIAKAWKQVQTSMEVGKPIHYIIDQVTELSRLLQVFLEDLHAGVLLGKKFEVALKTLVDDLQMDTAFPITVNVDVACEEHISREQGLELLHILREAIKNSVQYSQAKKGKVAVRMMDSQLVCEVSDNGRGFEVDLVGAQGRGLGNMVLRATRIGARLKVQSQPKKGATVLIELPLHQNDSNGNTSLPISSSPVNGTHTVLVG